MSVSVTASAVAAATTARLDQARAGRPAGPPVFCRDDDPVVDAFIVSVPLELDRDRRKVSQ
jgi:hypothetical protein